MLNILITGAASGIGKAVKEMFLKNIWEIGETKKFFKSY